MAEVSISWEAVRRKLGAWGAVGVCWWEHGSRLGDGKLVVKYEIGVDCEVKSSQLGAAHITHPLPSSILILTLPVT